MRGIFIATGSRGDLYPILGLARAMRAAGHDATVLTTANFGPEVRAAGVEFVEIADADTYAQLTRWAESVWLRSWNLRRWPRESVATLVELRERLVDVVTGLDLSDSILAVTVGLDLGVGDIIARKFRIPRAGIWINAHQLSVARPRLPRVLQPLPRALFNGFLRLWPEGRILRKHDAQLRHRLGMPPEPNLAKTMFSFDVDVCLFPAWYLPRHVRRAGMTFAGFPLFEPSSRLEAALGAFLDSGEPPIVFSNASWRSNLEDYYATALEAARQLGYRAVFVGASSPVLPTDHREALSIDYAPFDKLLSRAAAVVHHGGIGTVARAMAEATPQLVVPWTGDQPFNAARVESLGVGRKVGSRSSQARFVATLRAVLESQSIRSNSLRVARRLKQGPDYRETLRSLERIVRGTRL